MCDSLGLFNDDNDDVRSGAAGGGRSDLELNKIKWKQIQWLASSVFRSNSLLNVFQFAFVKGFCISKKKSVSNNNNKKYGSMQILTFFYQTV